MRHLQPLCAVRGALIALLFVAPGLPGQDSETPEFSLEIRPCAPLLERSPGLDFRLDFDLTLTTETNPSAERGAQGWSLSIKADGIEIVGITTGGTAAASVNDDPPGLRKNGFEHSELARGAGKGGLCKDGAGAISAVVLSITEVVTLPVSGTATVARLTTLGTAPGILGDRSTASLFYFDGCSGGGGPISNTITWMNMTVKPALGRCDFELKATADVFRRGDPNADGALDLSDAILILWCKFLGAKCPDCRDAGDANDDGLMDLSDAVHILAFLFLGGPPPEPPAGENTCGTDPTPDSLPPCGPAGC